MFRKFPLILVCLFPCQTKPCLPESHWPNIHPGHLQEPHNVHRCYYLKRGLLGCWHQGHTETKSNFPSSWDIEVGGLPPDPQRGC